VPADADCKPLYSPFGDFQARRISRTMKTESPWARRLRRVRAKTQSRIGDCLPFEIHVFSIETRESSPSAHSWSIGHIRQHAEPKPGFLTARNHADRPLLQRVWLRHSFGFSATGVCRTVKSRHGAEPCMQRRNQPTRQPGQRLRRRSTGSAVNALSRVSVGFDSTSVGAILAHHQSAD